MVGKCPMCGAPLEEKRCTYCRYESAEEKQVNENKNFMDVQSVQQQQFVVNEVLSDSTVITPGISRKSRTVALLLCIFLGAFGIHRFYVGKVGTGILYLVTVGFGGMGWLIDIVLIVTGSFKDEFALPLKQ